MRLSDTLTIYLAIGAPFTVNSIIRKSEGERRLKRFVTASLLGLMWPYVVLNLLIETYFRRKSDASKTRLEALSGKQIAGTKRRLLATIHRMREIAASSGDSPFEDLQRSTCVLCESIETYVGLDSFVKRSAVEATSDNRSMELMRIAGCNSNELEIAAMCATRRNAARVLQHHNRSRNQMVHAIADMRDTILPGDYSNASRDGAIMRLQSVYAEIIKLAIDLFGIMGDAASAKRIAGLLNYNLATHQSVQNSETNIVLSLETGEEPCQDNTPRPPRVLQANEVTLIQG